MQARINSKTQVGYATGIALVSFVTLLIAGINREVRIDNISMLYLVAVIVTAVAFGARAAVVASVAAFLAFDVFFVEPRYTFTVSDPSEWVALLLFLFTAIITGQLAARQRLRANEAEQREREASLLYDIARVLGTSDTTAAISTVAQRLTDELHLAALAIEIDSMAGPFEAGDEKAKRALHGAKLASFRLLSDDTSSLHPGRPRWVRAVGSAIGSRSSAETPEIVPIRAGERRVGTLSLSALADAPSVPLNKTRLLLAVSALVGAAAERERLRAEATEAEALHRADELKTALLNAVSHDLRTPLASIIASAGSLRQHDVQWSHTERDDFAEAIETQARRLDRLVGHLLDMSRIESGSLRPAKHWYDIEGLIGEVVGRMHDVIGNRNVVVEVAEDLPPIPLDYVQIDEVLGNLIENAARHTPADAEIYVTAGRSEEDDGVTVAVADSGPGIPEDSLESIFQPFVRGNTRSEGTGLGLAIAKGFVEAHGGHIRAANRPGGGAILSFNLPLATSEPTPEVAL